jgi:hypothetical protein
MNTQDLKDLIKQGDFFNHFMENVFQYTKQEDYMNCLLLSKKLNNISLKVFTNKLYTFCFKMNTEISNIKEVKASIDYYDGYGVNQGDKYMLKCGNTLFSLNDSLTTDTIIDANPEKETVIIKSICNNEYFTLIDRKTFKELDENICGRISLIHNAFGFHIKTIKHCCSFIPNDIINQSPFQYDEYIHDDGISNYSFKDEEIDYERLHNQGCDDEFIDNQISILNDVIFEEKMDKLNFFIKHSFNKGYILKLCNSIKHKYFMVNQEKVIYF